MNLSSQVLKTFKNGVCTIPLLQSCATGEDIYNDAQLELPMLHMAAVALSSIIYQEKFCSVIFVLPLQMVVGTMRSHHVFFFTKPNGVLLTYVKNYALGSFPSSCPSAVVSQQPGSGVGETRQHISGTSSPAPTNGE